MRGDLSTVDTMGTKGQRGSVRIEVASPTTQGRRNVKPINVAGCKDSSTTRRKRLPIETLSETPDRRCIVDTLAASMESTAKTSTFNRLTKKLQIMKRLSFLACGAPCSPAKKKQKDKKENIKISKTVLTDIGDVDDSVRIRAMFPEQSSAMLYLTMPKCGIYSRSPTPTRYESPDAVPSPMHSSSVRRCRQENLVKMMEKTLEDDKGREDARSEAAITQRRTRTTIQHESDPTREKRDHRTPKSRKIKTQRKRKAVHRRTATC